MTPPKAGCLIVAHPTLDDPNFARTVILLLAHETNDGSMGVILNRPAVVHDPSDTSPLTRWMDSSATPATLFIGGPVAPEGFLCLSRDDNSTNGVRSIDIMQDDPLFITEPYRLFRGYAGWGPGQLDHELTLNGWFVIDATADDTFTPNPSVLWNSSLARQPGELSRLGKYPTNPLLN